MSKEIYNRPGLSRIAYRIGSYTDFRNSFMRHLDRAVITDTPSPLSGWTYRASDDPGIALMESASILCDILTFYQSVYANEAYLRTAMWRESIARLVSLTGYLLSPGLAGEGWFAFEVSGENKIVIPGGFPITAQLEDLDQTADFETVESLIAYPELSNITLYPLIKPKPGTGNLREFHIGGEAFQDIKVGDRILVVCGDDEPDIDAKITDAEITMVDEVWELYGRQFFRIKGELTVIPDAISGTKTLYAFRLGRSFRHFGHNAPATYVSEYVPGLGGESPKIDDTEYDRSLTGSTTFSKPSFPKRKFPLDAEIDDLLPGTNMAFQLWDDESSVFSIREVWKIANGSFRWGALSATSTVVSVHGLGPDLNILFVEEGTKDIRDIEIHELISDCFPLEADVEQTGDNSKFLYIGNEGDFEKLVERDVLIWHPTSDHIRTKIVSIETPTDSFLKHLECRIIGIGCGINELTTSTSHEDGGFANPISFDNEEYIVYGNTTRAIQGKRESEIILGRGDSREIFQKFKLPKPPLTFVLSSEQSPSEAPELEIRVNGQLWTHVSSFYNKEDTDEVYIVRQDEDENSWVQFGDGKMGARLPSGIDNVTAIYRTGTGATGRMKEGTTVQPGGSITNLDGMNLVTAVSGGRDPEPGGVARIAAPGKLQALDRLVSIKDYETELLAVPGVIKARAEFVSYNKMLVIHITVLSNATKDDETNALREAIERYDKEHGAQRYAVIVTPGKFKYVYIGGSYSIDPKYMAENVKKGIEEALGVYYPETDEYASSNGLFSFSEREFRHPEYLTRIEAVIQNVPGVHWVHIDSLRSIVDVDDIDLLTKDGFPEPELKRVACSSYEILRLCHFHLDITTVGSSMEVVK